MNCPAESWVLPSEGWDWEFFLNLHWDLFCSVLQNHEKKHHSHFRPRRINVKNVGDLDIRDAFILVFEERKFRNSVRSPHQKGYNYSPNSVENLRLVWIIYFWWVFRHYFFYNFLFMIFFYNLQCRAIFWIYNGRRIMKSRYNSSWTRTLMNQLEVELLKLE